MTAFSITVTNSVNAFAAGPASLWNAYNWNAFKWGEGTATIPKRVLHQVTNALAPTAAVGGFQVRHLLTNQLVYATSSVNFRYTRVIANDLATTEDVSALYVQDPNGYLHGFPEGVSNAHLRTTPAWAAAASAAAAWTTAAAGTTTWS